MVRRTALFITLIMISVLLIGGGLVAFNNGLSAFNPGGQIFLPEYTTITCEELNTKISTRYDLADEQDLRNKAVVINSYDEGILKSDISVSFYCGSNNANGYIPYGCNYNIAKNDNKIVTYIRSPEGDFSLGFVERSRSIYLKSGEVMTVGYTGGESLLDYNDIVVTVNAQPYGLRKFNANGLVLQEGTCNVDQIAGYRGKAPEEDSGITIPPSDTQIIITGARLVTSPVDIISCDGEAVYIADAGGYYPTFDLGSYQYVDMRPEKRISSSKIQCIPSMGYCEVGDCKTTVITTVTPETGTCSKLLGTGSLGYVVTKTDSGKLIECKRGCDSSDKIYTTNECREVKTCTSDKPYRDPETGECVGFTSYPGQEVTSNNLLIPGIIIGVGALLAVVTYLLRTRRNI